MNNENVGHTWGLLFAAAVVLVSVQPVSGVIYSKVSDVRASMYTEMQYSRACYKNLNATGFVGCENPGMVPTTAPLIPYANLLANLGGPRVVLVALADLQALLQQVAMDPRVTAAVQGILVDPTGARPASLSSADTFPSARYAPYSGAGGVPPSYPWNSWGSGTSRMALGVPMYMLLPSLVPDARARAAYNAAHGTDMNGATHVAYMESMMQAQGNSTHCMVQGTCLPLGGYSVWSALPPLADPSYNTTVPKPITLVTCLLDSNSLFHDLTLSSNTAMSGLVVMLTAATLLAQSPNSATYPRQLVFSALAGEAWDLMGSRRLLYDMTGPTNASTTSVQGLRMDLIDQVISLASLGMAYNATRNATSLYVHRQMGAVWGDAAPLIRALSEAAAEEAASSGLQVSASRASITTPGLPPASAMSFMRHKPALQAVVLAEFDTAYTDTYHQSELDDGSNMSIQALVDSSLVLARALNTLAYGTAAPQPLQVSRQFAAALVVNLTACLVLQVPGLACGLAASLITPNAAVVYGQVSYGVSGYTGVLREVAADPTNSWDKPSLQRFVWNYLANVTALRPSGSGGSGAVVCDNLRNACPAGLSCVGWRFGDTPARHNATMGRCMNTTTRYTPAMSTRLFFGTRGRFFGWFLDNTSAWEAAWGWPVDPLWTESNWQYGVPYLRLYQLEARRVQVAIIVSGVLVSLATGVAAWGARNAFERHLKAD